MFNVVNHMITVVDYMFNLVTFNQVLRSLLVNAHFQF